MAADHLKKYKFCHYLSKIHKFRRAICRLYFSRVTLDFLLRIFEKQNHGENIIRKSYYLNTHQLLFPMKPYTGDVIKATRDPRQMIIVKGLYWKKIIWIMMNVEWIRLFVLLKLPPRKLEPWFVPWSLFLIRLFCNYINLPYGHAWNTVVMSGLVLLVYWNC